MIRALLLAGALVGACAAPSIGPRFALPEDPETVVVRLAKSRRGADPQPVLELTAGATIRTRTGSQALDAYTIQDLLAYIVDDQGFFEIDEKALQLAIHQSNSRHGGAIAVMDAATTTITVRLHDREHSVSQYALAFSAQRFSDIDALVRLAAIERRIVRFGAAGHLGGPAGAGLFLAQANRALAQNHPGVAPLTLDDLATAGTRRDGAIVAHFRRAATATTVTIATVSWLPGAQPEVRVESNEPR